MTKAWVWGKAHNRICAWMQRSLFIDIFHSFLENGRLVSEYYDGKTLEFFYDESGNPYALSYKSSASATPEIFYYVTNLQGDILQLRTASGSTAASYTYNAWGEVLTSSGDMADINPLRYRGYYYDAEIGFYYLQSRYYSPQLCRFINADEYTSTGQDFIGTNMFAYCNNNPVPNKDSSGTIGITALVIATAGIVGFVAGFATAVIGNAISGNDLLDVSSGGGSTSTAIRFYITTSSSSHTNAGASSGYHGTFSITLSEGVYWPTGSASVLLLPNTTYYLWCFPGSTTYGWWYWSGAATINTSGGAGLVRIDNGSSFVNAMPYIDNGSSWVQAMPYIDNGSSWVLCS